MKRLLAALLVLPVVVGALVLSRQTPAGSSTPSGGKSDFQFVTEAVNPVNHTKFNNAAATFRLCPGVLDTRWYSQLGIPAFAYGGGGLDVAHGPDEFIDEAAMRRCAAVYALFSAAF